MNKNILLVVLGCLILLLPIKVNAAILPEFELQSDEQVNIGENINVNVLVKNEPGVLNYDITFFVIKYESDVLEYVSFNGSNIFEFTEEVNGIGNIKFLDSYIANADSSYKVNSKDVIGTITFKIKDTNLNETTISYHSSYEGDYGNGTKIISIIKNTNPDIINDNKSDSNAVNNDNKSDSNAVNNDLKFYIVIGSMFAVIVSLLICIISIKRKSKEI